LSTAFRSIPQARAFERLERMMVRLNATNERDEAA